VSGKLETKTTTIRDVEVSVVQFDCWRQADLLEKLGKMAAPALRTLRGSTELGADEIGPFLGELFGGLETRERQQLQLEILAGTGVTVQTPTGPKFIELTSKERIVEACGSDLVLFGSLIAYAMEVNLGGFFAELMGKARTLLSAAKPPVKLTQAG